MAGTEHRGRVFASNAQASLEALDRDLSRDLVGRQRRPGLQYEAHDLQVAPLEQCGGPFTAQPFAKRADVDGLARKGMGQCHGLVSSLDHAPLKAPAVNVAYPKGAAACSRRRDTRVRTTSEP